MKILKVWLSRTGAKYFCLDRSRFRLIPGALSREEGQSLVLLALALVVLLGMTALAIDGGMVFVQRAQAQNAADAAAIAGARQLALSGTDNQIASVISEYAVTRNGADSFAATYYPGGSQVGGGSVPGNAIGVNVVTRITFSTFFAGILGYHQVTVSAQASAATGSTLEPGPSTQPLATECPQPTLGACGFEFGDTYDIWEGGGPGNFGWLSWNGSNNAPYVEQELTPGNQPDYVDPHGVCTGLAVGCWVQGLPGVKNSSGNRNQLNNWIALGESGTPMIVIIYDSSEGGGSHTNYHIVGFAAFILESYNLPHGRVTGRFIEWVTGAPVASGGDQYGLVSVHMIKPSP